LQKEWESGQTKKWGGPEKPWLKGIKPHLGKREKIPNQPNLGRIGNSLEENFLPVVPQIWEPKLSPKI